MSERISVNEILMRIQAASREAGVKLTFTNTKVYMGLLDYADKHKDIVVNYSYGVRFDMTTLDLAEYCNVSPRIVAETLQKLKKSGIIKHVTKKPNPSVVTIYRQFYE